MAIVVVNVAAIIHIFCSLVYHNNAESSGVDTHTDCLVTLSIEGFKRHSVVEPTR